MKINKKLIVVAWGATTLLSAAFSPAVVATESSPEQVDQSIQYFCSKKDVATEQSISIGEATQVNLNSGPFYFIQSKSDYRATLDLVTREMANIGISPDCAEYLMTHSRLQGYNQGNVMARVYFDFDRYNLTEESKYILNVVANVVKQNPSQLTIEGHTDNVGSKEYNFTLGLKRSEAAQQYLQARGVDTDSMLMVSKGEGEPIADNKTSQGRVQNRRVDVVDETPSE